jgi:hypothetical protein
MTYLAKRVGFAVSHGIQVEILRRQRFTGKQIALELGLSAATVSRILRRLGLNRIDALEPSEPVRRYERERPGEMIHLDIKKLGRINASVIASLAIAEHKAACAQDVKAPAGSSSTSP